MNNKTNLIDLQIRIKELEIECVNIEKVAILSELNDEPNSSVLYYNLKIKRKELRRAKCDLYNFTWRSSKKGKLVIHNAVKRYRLKKRLEKLDAVIIK